MDRALYGAEEHVFYHGEIRATRRRYNERLVMFILRNRAGDRYAAAGGARGLSGLDKQQLKRLKKQWREEWNREQEEERGTFDGNAFIEQLEQMHRRWYAALSRRARAAYREFRRIERDDSEAGYVPDDEEVADAQAEYAAGAASHDDRAKVKLWIEADGFGVDEVLAEEEDAAGQAETPEPGNDAPPPEPAPE